MSPGARRALARGSLAALGLALVVYLIRDAGPDRVAAVLWQAGAWLPLILALEAFQLGSDYVALRLILGERAARVPAATWVRSCAIAYAMMILVPAGRAAGEVTRATFLSRYIGGAPRAAAVGTQFQAAYLSANGILSAVGCAVVASRFGLRSPLALLLAGNVLAQAAISAGLIGILWDARVGRWLDRMRRRFVRGAAESPPLDREARRHLPWKAAVVSSVSRAAQVVQYGIVLHAVGGVATVRNAFVTHGIHLVGATLGDMMPNQLGVVDGMYRAFADDVGFGDAPARALSIAFVIRIAQLTLAGACVVVAAAMRHAASPGGASPASADADARS
ncbi:MAG TPA: hypothetical protein VIF15_08850 [Polyangiaceae bacterium]